MSEVQGNNLVERDPETNAIIPVMQAYSTDMPGKETQGNRLVVRDVETNAIVPVVKIIGAGETNPSEPSMNEEQVRTIVQKEIENAAIGTIPGAVANSFGSSTTNAISQAFVTETASNWANKW